MIVALVGRRIDAPNAAAPIFPLAAVPLVRERIGDLFRHQEATALVCSAACGADLLALEAARTLGIRRRIVLPFAALRFRESSVVDRPGNWGPLYDELINEASAQGDLVDLGFDATNDACYVAANQAIIDEAYSLANAARDAIIAVLVWNGVSRGESDITSGFGEAARARDWAVLEISTL
jgi:hypothetical protein